MGATSSTFQVIWTFFEGSTIAFKDRTEIGLQAAIDAARKLAESANFNMGQVLSEDGRVLATVAPGHVKLNKD